MGKEEPGSHGKRSQGGQHWNVLAGTLARHSCEKKAPTGKGPFTQLTCPAPDWTLGGAVSMKGEHGSLPAGCKDQSRDLGKRLSGN